MTEGPQKQTDSTAKLKLTSYNPGSEIIYFILAEHESFECSHKYVMINHTKQNIKRILASIDSPFKISLIRTIPGNKYIKEAIHQHLNKWRMRENWFQYESEVEKYVNLPGLGEVVD